jgi:hypothetical protein
MGSLIEKLRRREAAARHEVDELRGEIAGLNERLARAEERLSRLEITRETVAEILGGAGTDQPAAGRQTEAARRKAAIHLVIDLVHVLEHLWAAAWCFHARDDPAAEDWVAAALLRHPERVRADPYTAPPSLAALLAAPGPISP